MVGREKYVFGYFALEIEEKKQEMFFFFLRINPLYIDFGFKRRRKTILKNTS